MKKVFNSTIFLACALILFRSTAFSQPTGPAPKYISVAYLKSKSQDFINMEKDVWVAVHKQLIKEGRKAAWYMYRVKYPSGTKTDYDYVRFNVFIDWKQTENPYAGYLDIMKKVHPTLNIDEFTKKSEQSRDKVWEQLYQVIDEAATKIKEPSKFIIVNQMKTVSGAEEEYIKLERTYFKPFHTERVARGVMNNWGIYKPAIPYGDKYGFDYVTFNGFQTWEDIIKNNPPDIWQKVHGNVNFNEIHSKILEKRTTVNNELWELVAFAVE